ncbi:MAG: hypothetical protein K0M45_11350 [Candidatus Paracaedibacteraceae bacterium]|nr:hypothetical protein [Candidatus Paracaedibacteraceae bacterium]
MILKYLKFCLFMVIGLTDNHLYAMERDEDPFRFKIGFEFQEANHLFPQGANNFDIQKKTIFIAMKDDRELWHVEIDGSDIEFVTPPFTVAEREYLFLSMESIQQACQILKELSQHTNNQVSFQQWIEGIQGVLSSQEENTLRNLRNRVESVAESEKNKSIYRTAIEKLEIKKSATSVAGLREKLKEDGITLDIADVYYNSIKEEMLYIQSSWKPEFMPQVTIQHSLKDTIPLIMGLFGSQTGSPTAIEQQLNYALPLLQAKHILDDREYLTEENGLLFLHAFTCANIQHSSSPSPQELLNSLAIIKENFDNYKQVDAKVNLSFLSRRPFSQMWAEIKEKKTIPFTFRELYEERIIKENPLFAEKVVPNFEFVNYAEEYYKDASTREDFSFFIDALREKFLQSHGENLILELDSESGVTRKLLKQGIVSTGLIAYLYPATFKNYLSEAIKTVDQPSYRYIFNKITQQPLMVESDVDALSPPWFQDTDNSMGAYQNLDTIDLSYGEAIIEMRFVKRISRNAFQAMGLHSQDARTFLKGTERSLKDDGESLLSILSHDFILNSYQKVMEKYK